MRLGTARGSAIAAGSLMTVTSHRSLEAIVVLLLRIGGSTSMRRKAHSLHVVGIAITIMVLANLCNTAGPMPQPRQVTTVAQPAWGSSGHVPPAVPPADCPMDHARA